MVRALALTILGTDSWYPASGKRKNGPKVNHNIERAADMLEIAWEVAVENLESAVPLARKPADKSPL